MNQDRISLELYNKIRKYVQMIYMANMTYQSELVNNILNKVLLYLKDESIKYPINSFDELSIEIQCELVDYLKNIRNPLKMFISEYNYDYSDGFIKLLNQLYNDP